MRYLSGVRHRHHLAIDGDADAPGPAGIDGQFGGGYDLECAGLTGAADQRLGEEHRQIAGAGPRREIDEQLALIEPLPGTEPNAVDRVFVVADEDERRLPGPLAAVHVDAHRDAAIPSEDAERRHHHGRPLAVSLTPQLFPLFDDVRIDADGGVVDEDAIVHLRRRPLARGGRAATTATACAKIERDAEILGEVIERAEREDAERAPANRLCRPRRR